MKCSQIEHEREKKNVWQVFSPDAWFITSQKRIKYNYVN